MTWAQERIDIEGRLNTNWSTTSIAMDNAPFTPTSGTAWIRLTILPGSAGALGFGRDTDIEYAGIIDIGIFVPIETGSSTARGYADTLGALFNLKAFGSVDCDEARALNLGKVDGWYQWNVTTPYSRIE